MQRSQRLLILLTIICLIATAFGFYVIAGVEPEQIQIWLQRTGVWAPIVYIFLYVIATILVLPSTPLNLSGGVIFGLWMGTFLTSIAAILAAVVAFAFTRSFGYKFIARKIGGRWQALDAEIRSGGYYYIFALRLLPIIPYGLVNFAAGLTSIRFQSYLWGTVLGTVPGVLPFVMMGSFGLQALRTGDVLPLLGALSLTGLLVAGATWYRRRRSFNKPE